jgi:hypothetical protein
MPGTVDSITEVYDWYNAQEEELSLDTVSTFSPTLNRRDWFESIQSYLAAKKGQAGVPLTYVILTTGVIDPAAPDVGFGAPTFDDDIARRGRRDGHFWRPDNNVNKAHSDVEGRILTYVITGHNFWLPTDL